MNVQRLPLAIMGYAQLMTRVRGKFWLWNRSRRMALGWGRVRVMTLVASELG
jgi:hypothetical protein